MIVSLFLVPFTGVLVRYRASYHPLGLAVHQTPPSPSQQVAPESAEASSVTASQKSAKGSSAASAAKEPEAVLVAPTLLGVGKRIKRIEVSR